MELSYEIKHFDKDGEEVEGVLERSSEDGDGQIDMTATAFRPILGRFKIYKSLLDMSQLVAIRQKMVSRVSLLHLSLLFSAPLPALAMTM